MEILGAQRSLEDKQVEVDLRRRGGQVGERVGGCILFFGRGEWKWLSWWWFGCRRRSAFDHLVEARFCRHSEEIVVLS